MPGSLVTMLFTDIVNSTLVKSRLPGADVAARNRAYLESVLTPHRQRVEAFPLNDPFSGVDEAYGCVLPVAARSPHAARS